MTIAFGPQTCGSLDEAAAREWLVADGVGGYAMGTVAGLRTRRYHGLLVVAVDGPGARMLGLAALDPVLVVGDARIRLATDEWGSGSVDPTGHELLASFDLADGVPRWRWQAAGILLERELAAVHGSRDGRRRPPAAPRRSARDARADSALHLAERPRGASCERRSRGRAHGWRVCVRRRLPRRGRRLAARWELVPGRAGARGGCSRASRPRGPLGRRLFRVELEPGDCHELTAAASGEPAPPSATKIVAAARSRAAALLAGAKAADETDARLVLAADQFAIRTSGRPTAVAGYPWFGEWSRDLMTSYEGLYLSTGRADEGREVLRTSAATVSEGMLANTADTGSLEYNTADGTLWFVHALGRHVSVTGDDDLGSELAPVLEQIVQHHLDGTRYGIGVDPGRRPAPAGRRRPRPHLDGRQDRRRPGDPARREGRRGERALAAGARGRARARRRDGLP